MWEDVERAYIAATAPNETGLRALQVSVAQSRLGERVARARKTARNDSTRKLLDRVEVVMARLEMMEADNFDTVDAFGALVHKSDLKRQLEAAMDVQGESPEVRGVLLEVRLIIGGVEHVG